MLLLTTLLTALITTTSAHRTPTTADSTCGYILDFKSNTEPLSVSHFLLDYPSVPLTIYSGYQCDFWTQENTQQIPIVSLVGLKEDEVYWGLNVYDCCAASR